MEDHRTTYKNAYSGIFSAYYFIEGMNQSIIAVIVPIYLLSLIGSISPSVIALLASIVMIPWAIKLIFGILSDKFSVKNYGRRRPWILAAGLISGIVWILTPFIMPRDSTVVYYFMGAGFLSALGVAMGDTALDGLILDICPKDQLGRVQGFCWGSRSVGVMVGGPLIALVIVFMPIEAIFLIFGILILIFSLLTLIVKEPPISTSFELGTQLKSVFKTGKNWKVFIWAFWDTIVEAVVVLFVSLYLLIQLGFVQPEGATIDLLDDDINLYVPQAFITLIIGIGIIIGAVVGGFIADRSRKKAIYIAYFVAIPSYLIMVINIAPGLFIVFAIIIGLGYGLRNAAFAAVLGEISQQYPKINSTYYSIGTSFANLGGTLGLLLVGEMFNVFAGFSSDIIVIYGGVFIFMALLQIAAPIFFAFIKSEEYEITRD